MEKLKELIDFLNGDGLEGFKKDLAGLEKGNKSAGKRARKTTSALTKLFKEFRAESIANEKK